MTKYRDGDNLGRWFPVALTLAYHIHKTCKYENHDVSEDHEDNITWTTFPHYWPSVRIITRPPVNYLNKGPVIRSFDVFGVVWLKRQMIKQQGCCLKYRAITELILNQFLVIKWCYQTTMIYMPVNGRMRFPLVTHIVSTYYFSYNILTNMPLYLTWQ